jgi:hypothetical protein
MGSTRQSQSDVADATVDDAGQCEHRLESGAFQSLTGRKVQSIWDDATYGKLAGGSGAFQKIADLYSDGTISDEERKAMQAGNGGKLNPTWVEWLMGFPTGWTDLEDSETL